MTTLLLLGRRNLRVFVRDRASVFFAMLSPIILIALYVLFLGNLQEQSLKENFPQAAGEDISAFVTSWVFAGIAMITTLTAALASMASFVDDGATGRFRDFLVSPIRRSQLILGYFLSSFSISFAMSFVVTLIGQVYLQVVFGAGMSAVAFLTCVGYLVLSSAVFSAFCAFVVSFVKTNSAYGALSAIVGTLAGFLAGAYIPPGALPTGAVAVMNSLPFAQAAVLIRHPFTEVTADRLAGGNAEAAQGLSDTFGMTGPIGSFDVSTPLAIVGLLVIFVILVALGTWRIGRRIK